jgi:outer membrane protein OmpA-like peptidoglycan-associated protein
MRKVLFFLFGLVIISLSYESSKAQGIFVPSGTGAWGNVIYGGGGFTAGGKVGDPVRKHDAKAGVGIGLGNPITSYGVQLQANLLNVSDFNAYSFGVKVHKYVANGISVAAGFQNGLSGGSGDNDILAGGYRNGSKVTDSPTGYFAAMSHNLGYNFGQESFFSKITYGLAVVMGTSTRLSDYDRKDDLKKKGKDGIGDGYGTFLAASVKYKISNHFGYHLEWTGVSLNTALSAQVKVGPFPIAAMIGVADLATMTKSDPRFIVSLGTAYKFPEYKKEQKCNTEKIEELLRQNQVALNEQLQQLQKSNDKLSDDHKDLANKLDSLQNKVNKVEAASQQQSYNSAMNYNAADGTIGQPIYFDLGKAKLRAESISELDKVASLLKGQYANGRVEIGGHADETGSVEANTRLSKNRAKAAADYLISKQVAASRIDYKGYSSSKPVASNSTEEGRQKNRRVELKLVK